MKRLSDNRDLFQAAAGEVITVSVEASKTPYQVTFSDLESGGQWTVIQQPTAQQPVEIRSYKMPANAREIFVIVYAFPPQGQANADARYILRFSGADGTTDGPDRVLPPASGDIQDLPYEFRLAGAPLTHFMPASLATKVAGNAAITAPAGVAGGNR